MSVRHYLLNIILIVVVLNLLLSAALIATVITKVQYKNQIDYNKMKTSEYQMIAAQYRAQSAELLFEAREAQLRAFLEQYGR